MLIATALCKKKKYQQNICFGGYENFKERCYFKGIHYTLAVRMLKNLMPNIKIELNVMSREDYIRRKGRVVYPKIVKDSNFIETQVKKELESLSKMRTQAQKKTAKSGNYAKRILEEQVEPRTGQPSKTELETKQEKNIQADRQEDPKQQSKGTETSPNGESMPKNTSKHNAHNKVTSSESKNKKEKKEQMTTTLEEKSKKEQSDINNSKPPVEKKQIKENSEGKTNKNPKTSNTKDTQRPKPKAHRKDPKSGQPSKKHSKGKHLHKKPKIDLKSIRNPGGLIGKILKMAQDLLKNYKIEDSDSLLEATLVIKKLKPIFEALATRREPL